MVIIKMFKSTFWRWNPHSYSPWLIYQNWILGV